LSRYWYQRPAPRRAPPARGIKVRGIGGTWWGKRWIGGLEKVSRDYLNRLGRGRAYARAGRVHDLRIDQGLVTAHVTGSESRPYVVTLRVKTLSDAAWHKALLRMSREARFTAELLAGQMPRDIDHAFAAAGCSLFPAKQSDLETDCSCPDWASPCKHVAATHYVLGDAFDRDPWLLFELRGRSKADVLEALSRLRSGSAAKAAPEPSAAIRAASLEGMAPGDYDRLRTPLPHLHLTFAAPAEPAAILRPLGSPAGWTLEDAPADLLAPHYRAAAERARALAYPVDERDTAPATLPAKKMGTERARKRAVTKRTRSPN